MLLFGTMNLFIYNGLIQMHLETRNHVSHQKSDAHYSTQTNEIFLISDQECKFFLFNFSANFRPNRQLY